ncbi:MAG: Hsp20/alpha crystallin family protein [Chloroflexota bacterium]
MLWRNYNGFGRHPWLGRSLWRDFDRLQNEMDRLWETLPGFVTPTYPPLNVWSGEDSILVTAEVPGVSPDSLEITVDEDTLTLSGNRNGEPLAEGETYHRRERGYGDFTRTVQLPYRVEADAVEATFSKGVLTIELPRTEADRPRKITVH